MLGEKFLYLYLKVTVACKILPVGFLRSVLFDCKDGGDEFGRNTEISPNSSVLQHRR
jgi:hypothetical protein